MDFYSEIVALSANMSYVRAATPAECALGELLSAVSILPFHRRSYCYAKTHASTVALNDRKANMSKDTMRHTIQYCKHHDHHKLLRFALQLGHNLKSVNSSNFQLIMRSCSCTEFLD
nr:AlNc14C278G10076 [Albugo laibachii Nc14]|eukprot:CCA25163.1 AlNc14C278G10076 [Albugo laibachii Nc14]